MLQHSILQLSDVAPWGWWQQLLWGSCDLAATVESLVKEESHLHSRQKEQEVTVFRDTAELRTTQVLCCKGEKPQDDSHRSSGWTLPEEGSVETSGSLKVLSRLHDPAIALLHTTLPKELKRQHGHYIGFIIGVIIFRIHQWYILRYAPIILIQNTFSFTTSLLDLTVCKIFVPCSVFIK